MAVESKRHLRSVNASCCGEDCSVISFDVLIHLVVAVFVELVTVVAVNISMIVAVIVVV